MGAAACEKKRSEMTKALDALAELAGKEIKSTGKFTIPGVCMVKTRHKPATKAGKRIAFGKEIKVKAKAARTVVKAFAVAAMKQAVCKTSIRSRVESLRNACRLCELWP